MDRYANRFRTYDPSSSNSKLDKYRSKAFKICSNRVLLDPRQKWTDDLDAISTQFMFGSQVYPSWLVTVVSHTIIIVSFSKKRRSKNGELRNAAADFCPG